MLDEVLKTLIYPDVKDVLEAIEYEGDPMNLPVFFENQGADLESSAPYCVVTLVTDDNQQASFGNRGSNRFRKTGRIVVEINVPIGTGTSKIDLITSVLEDEYKPTKATLPDVRFRAAIPNTPGFRVGDNWQVTVDLPFMAERRA